MPLTDGGCVTVIRMLGCGGQGAVFLADLSGRKVALKWYLRPAPDGFYRNLERNIHSGAPSDAFIWPERLTMKDADGCFGYVMRLCPEGYSGFGRYLLAEENFSSVSAMLTAAMRICEGFRMLHLCGLSYQDINDGSFLISPETGDVLICDNDNVTAQGEKSGIMGKSRYMAPEVLAGGTPDKLSDRFSLSVILFLLFFADHPFEGAKTLACECMTAEMGRRLYGSGAVFILDPDNAENRPVSGIHQNVIRRWPLFPKVLRDAFVREFSREKLMNPESRMLEQEWEDIIEQARDGLVVCPHCGEETFTDVPCGSASCAYCGRRIDMPEMLVMEKVPGRRYIPLTAGRQIFAGRGTLPDAEVTEDSCGRMIVRNISSGQLTAAAPGGNVMHAGHQEALPAEEGIRISFCSGGRVYNAAVRRSR